MHTIDLDALARTENGFAVLADYFEERGDATAREAALACDRPEIAAWLWARMQDEAKHVELKMESRHKGTHRRESHPLSSAPLVKYGIFAEGFTRKEGVERAVVVAAAFCHTIRHYLQSYKPSRKIIFKISAGRPTKTLVVECQGTAR